MVDKNSKPTIHDLRAVESRDYGWSSEDYVSTLVKSVNPHLNPKTTLQEFFPSAKIVVSDKSPVIEEDKEYCCEVNGCDFTSPILTLEVTKTVVNHNQNVVKKVVAHKVFTCPICLSQEISVWNGA